MIILLNNVNADVVGDTQKNPGADLSIAIFGTLGGGTITLEGSPDAGVTWLPLLIKYTNAPATFTTTGLYTTNAISVGYSLRARLTGSTAASGVFVTAGII